MASQFRRFLAALAVLAGAPAWAAAQGGTIEGRITDRASGQPITNAQVLIVGTTRGSLSGEDGTYRLANVTPGAVQVRALRIGYSAATQAVTVTAGQTVTADFSLAPSALQLDQVTVSAITGQGQRRREQGTNVGNIQVADMELAPITKFADVLTGREPGVNLQGVSGSLGTGQRIRIRGANSLSLSNEPLIYVDGVQVSNSTGLSFGVGGQDASRLNDLNSEDIESIEVIKGPAASALYGTAAANGVLLVTTKRGRAGSTRWNFFTEFAQTEDRTDYPANFYAYRAPTTAGAPLLVQTGPLIGTLDRTARPRCTNFSAGAGTCVQDSVLVFNTLEDPRTTPFSKGNAERYGLSVSGGTDRVSYFFSADMERESGVIDYNVQDKLGFRANVNAQLRDNVNLTFTSSYINNQLILNSNDNNIFSPLINGLVGAPIFFERDQGNPLFCLTTEGDNCLNYGFFFTNGENREFVTNQAADRFTLGVNATWQPIAWLSLNANGGFDLTDRHDFQTVQPDRVPIAESFAIGFRQSQRTNNFLYTGNASATATYDLTEDIALTSAFGASYSRGLLENTLCSGAGIVAGTASCGGTVRLFDVDEDFQEIITIGGFFRQQFSWRDRLFLSASVRGDDNSAFGQDFGLVYYPAASLSWVVGEEPWFPQLSLLSSVRLRGAFGVSGLRPNFRDAETFLNTVAVTRSNLNVAATTLANLGNPDLKPERTTEYEGGFDLGLFRERVALDFTYFSRRSKDALVLRQISPSFGLTQTTEGGAEASDIFQNLGSIRNWGTELGLTADVVNRPNARFTVRFTNSTLDNEIEELGEDIAPIIFNRGNQRHQESYPAGAFFQRPMTFSDANGDGKIALAEVQLGDTAVFIGTSLPEYTRTLAFDLTVFKYFSVTTLFDQRGGHKQLNDTEQFRCTTALSRGDRGCAATDDPNASLFDQARFVASRFLGSRVGYIEDADFVKWRELALTIRAPESLIRRFGAVRGASLTLAGRNLQTWTDYSGLDPEVNETGGDTNFTQGEFNTQPPVRSFIARFNFTF
ncbi:MAG: SusC/RagA family TonB-linked outer membrane protein [Gemmatimonadaceae bacterium]